PVVQYEVKKLDNPRHLEDEALHTGLSEAIKKLEADPQANSETLQTVREELQIIEGLWENYHIGMNVFRNAKGGRDGIREVKTD
ncbi:MAG: hypothetical protein LV477_07425, partial [Candidatus Nitrosotalea sp.]|nr:hypothetical protein [Candidatus Nitrosotalea sp.]